MNWRTHLGNLASGAQALAQSAIEQGVPVAKRVAEQVRTAAATVVDEVVKVSERSHPAAKPAPQVTTTSDAPPAKDPIAVRTEHRATIDLNGLSITADDAKELARRPQGLEQATLDIVVGASEPTAEQAEEIRHYIASTPATVFEASARIDANAPTLRERGQLEGHRTVWQGVREATVILQAYDKANGTDFAASSWLAMMRSWDKADIAPANIDAASAAATAIHLASESPRAHHHASDVCAQLLATAHVTGWPSILFDDAGGVAKLANLLRSAASHDDLKAAVAKSAFGVAGAMLLTPVSDAEVALPRMNPAALRAEVGLALCDVLDDLGSTSHDAMRTAVQELAASPAANPSAAELHELSRLPTWLVSHDFAFGNDAQRFARNAMAPAQAVELSIYVAETMGDIGAVEKRLKSLWIAPRVCAELATRFGVEAKPPINGLKPGSFIADGVEVSQNLQRALCMLAAFDEKHGTRHGIDGAKALIQQATLGPRHRELVEVLRDIFAGKTATADDKQVFFAEIPGLIDSNAWPAVGLAGPMQDLIRGLTEKAKANPDLANGIFVTGFKIVNAEVRIAPNDDALGRAAVAHTIAVLADALGRPTDAAIYRAIEERLRAAIP